MSLIAAALRELIALGVEGEALIAAIARIEAAGPAIAPVVLRSKAAERMARYRDRRVENGMTKGFAGADFIPALLARDGPGCAYCLADHEAIDHIWPIAQKGTDHLDNLALVCRTCNAKKAGRTPVEAGYVFRRESAHAAHVRYVREHVRQEHDCEHVGEHCEQCSPIARVRDITLPTEITGKKERKESLSSNDDFELAWKAYPHIKGRSSKRKTRLEWPKVPVSIRRVLPAAIRRYASEGREPSSDCGAAAMERWIRDERFLDWLPVTEVLNPKTPEEQAEQEAKWRAYTDRLEAANG